MLEDTTRDTTMGERLLEYLPVVTTFACVGSLAVLLGRSLNPERVMLRAALGFVALWMAPFVNLTGIACLVGLLIALVAAYRGSVPNGPLRRMWRQVGFGIVGTLLAWFILALSLRRG